jgi:hypothetical protein
MVLVQFDSKIDFCTKEGAMESKFSAILVRTGMRRCGGRAGGRDGSRHGKVTWQVAVARRRGQRAALAGCVARHPKPETLYLKTAPICFSLRALHKFR